MAFEAGFMLALGKPVLLLKDKTLRSLHADLDGKLYKEFDTRNQKKTVTGPLRLQHLDLRSEVAHERIPAGRGALLVGGSVHRRALIETFPKMLSLNSL